MQLLTIITNELQFALNSLSIWVLASMYATCLSGCIVKQTMILLADPLNQYTISSCFSFVMMALQLTVASKHAIIIASIVRRLPWNGIVGYAFFIHFNARVFACMYVSGVNSQVMDTVTLFFSIVLYDGGSSGSLVIWPQLLHPTTSFAPLAPLFGDVLDECLLWMRMNPSSASWLIKNSALAVKVLPFLLLQLTFYHWLSNILLDIICGIRLSTGGRLVSGGFFASWQCCGIAPRAAASIDIPLVIELPAVATACPPTIVPPLVASVIGDPAAVPATPMPAAHYASFTWRWFILSWNCFFSSCFSTSTLAAASCTTFAAAFWTAASNLYWRATSTSFTWRCICWSWSCCHMIRASTPWGPSAFPFSLAPIIIRTLASCIIGVPTHVFKMDYEFIKNRLTPSVTDMTPEAEVALLRSFGDDRKFRKKILTPVGSFQMEHSPLSPCDCPVRKKNPTNK